MIPPPTTNGNGNHSLKKHTSDEFPVVRLAPHEIDGSDDDDDDPPPTSPKSETAPAVDDDTEPAPPTQTPKSPPEPLSGAYPGHDNAYASGRRYGAGRGG